MKEMFKDYLFTKHVIVAEDEHETEESFNVIVAFAKKLGINITKGMQYANLGLFEYASNQLGEYIPQPFYRGFPETVKALTQEELLFDQLFHYYITYGCGNFDEAGHSYFESEFERLVFDEDVSLKDYVILTEKEANEYLNELVDGLLESSRPLSESNYNIVLSFIKENKKHPKSITCKQTAVRLLYDTRSIYPFILFLNLADVIKLVDYINYKVYDNEDLKKLNLKNKDRKFITKVIDTCFADTQKACNTRECFEKRKIWCGLLHHIHYQPKNDYARDFVDMIRSGENISVYSRFEEEMSADNVVGAARVLSQEKGSSVVLRNLNYLLSRCKNEEEVKGVLSWVK